MCTLTQSGHIDCTFWECDHTHFSWLGTVCHSVNYHKVPQIFSVSLPVIDALDQADSSSCCVLSTWILIKAECTCVRPFQSTYGWTNTQLAHLWINHGCLEWGLKGRKFLLMLHLCWFCRCFITQQQLQCLLSNDRL